MTTHRNRRRLNALLGVFLVGIATGAIVLLSGDILTRPVLVGQVVFMGLAGVCNLVAAVDGQVIDGWTWYRWSGLGNILLGLSLPLGFIGSDDQLVFLLVTGAGGLSLAAIGVDLLAFHGKYTLGDRLDHDGN